MNFEMEGCKFEQCGWQTGAYGTFHLDRPIRKVTLMIIWKELFSGTAHLVEITTVQTAGAGVTSSMRPIWTNLFIWNIKM